MNSGKVFLGILAGLTAGAALGLLFAPEKGSDTIKKISKKGNDFVGKLDLKFDHFLETISKKIDPLTKDSSVDTKQEK